MLQTSLLPRIRSLEEALASVVLALHDLAASLEEDGGLEASTAEPASLVNLPRTEAIEAVLDQVASPVAPVAIWKLLHSGGRDDPKMEVQVTTYDLWRRGRIDKVGRGLYVAKQHRPDELPAVSWVEQ